MIRLLYHGIVIVTITIETLSCLNCITFVDDLKNKSMQIKFLKTVLDNGECQYKITHLAWSPNSEKLAVATSDRHVLLFDGDGKRRDKFSTKPVDPAAGKKSYIVKGLAFSPDSTKLAVGQSDNVVYVYKLGDDWGAKKSICNKILQPSPVTCLSWLTKGLLVCGLCDGKIQKLKITSNKSSTLSATESLVIALCSNVNGNGFLSGHINGNVLKFVIDESNGEKIVMQNFLTYTVSPYVLVWGYEHVFVSGSNKRLAIYDERGKLTKTIDYNKDGDQSFTTGCCSPSGQLVVFGSSDKLRILAWNTKMSIWNELPPKEIKNLYTVTALAWSYDGSKISCGTIGGLLLYFESVMKRTVWKNLYVINYIGPSQILLKSLSDGKEVNIKTYTGREIDDVKILGQDSYIVARTSETLIVGDLHRKLISEVLWTNTGRNEKLYFENPDICLVFNVGELSLIEYGDNNLLGSVRTEFANPHLISVRTDRDANNKKRCTLAYLLDLKTICIMNLISASVLAQINHETKIDWLELSESMSKLLFRDIKQRLMLIDLKTMQKSSILSGVSFVQWIEGSDVAVAQRDNKLAVWYNIDLPDHPTMVNVQGNVIDVVRNKEKTQAIAMDGNNTLVFDLDDGLVEFGTAMHENDYARAIMFLETVEDENQTKSLWHNLANIAFEKHQFLITARCYAAMGNVAKARYFQVLHDLSKQSKDSYENNPEILARLALLDGNVFAAENVYMELGEVDKALQLFKGIHKWDVAMKLAEKIGYIGFDKLKSEYIEYLNRIDRPDKMAEIYKNDGNIEESATLFVKSKRFMSATNLLLENFNLFSETVTSTILKQLIKNEYYEAAAQIYEKLDNKDMALECYKRANVWIKAVELVRLTNPNEVTTLEEEWGDYLVKSRQLDAAINHYIEAGKTVKALEASVGAAQWKKAIHIMQVIDDLDVLTKYSTVVANHYLNNKDYHTVEKIYLRAEMYTEIVNMYNDIRQWEKGFQVAKVHLEETERNRIYTKLAEQLETDGKLKDAEKVYVLIDSPDLAIAMYKRNERYESMLRLIEFYHPEYLETTQIHIAQDLETNGKYRKAETYYLAVGKWKEVVNMYRGHGMWEDAYRVAKEQGTAAAIQVAFLWAKSLPVESGIKLLNKYGILESAIDYACEIYDFDFAFKLCKNLTAKIKEVHYKRAMALEDEGKFNEAETEFIAADKAREAVSMYIHGSNWINALRVAEMHEPAIVNEVLTAQALHCFKDKQYLEFESLLLRAQMPETIIETYKKADMWSEAIRICKEYLPNYLSQLQSEANLSNVALQNKSDNWQSTVSELVQSGNYKQAVLVMVDATRSMHKIDEVRTILLKACEVVNKFVLDEDIPEVVTVLAPRLIEGGEYLAASQLYINVDMMKEAIDTLVLGEEWQKAKQLAKELNPTYVNYVENKQKEKLLKQGNAEHLFDIDILGALDLLVEQGQWNKCLEKAKQHGTPTLHKYVAQYAANLLQNGEVIQALNLYTTYGAPALPQNLNIYNRIANYLFAMPNVSDDYNLWDELRQMLYALTEGLNALSSVEKDAKDHFMTLLLVAHYYTTRAACRQISSLQFLGARISVALLRYTHVIPVDKAFYEAGIDVRKEGRTTEAFVFLNHYLDVCEVIEESSQALDYTDFQNTDFPNNVPIPGNLYLQDNPEEHDNIKEWVLTISMDQGIEQELPVDKRGLYESSLSNGQQQCIVSGYPIETEFVSFVNGYFALKDVWSKVHMVSKMSPESNMAHTCSFIMKWCGVPQ